MSGFKKRLLESSNYGKLILLIGLLTIVPLAILPFYPQDARYAPAFLIPSAASLGIGAPICFCVPRKEERITEWRSPLQRGSTPVMFAWCFAFFAGAIPFVIGNQLSLSLALFESISGWTTTGLSVADVTVLPHIFLFHRAFMQYCGGLGFIIVITMLVNGKQNMNLYSAEGHSDRLMPSLKKTSRTIFMLYSGFLFVGTLLYCVFGMNLFDSICHTMAALSTAGFTTQAASIGHYGSAAIELITILLMLVGASNFAILLLLVKGRFRQILRVSESRFMLCLIGVFIALTTLPLMNEGMGALESIRNAAFGVVTALTTTGYSTMNYSAWPPFSLGLLILLMIIGGSAGSTAGGIKLIRTYLLIRITKNNIVQRISPARKVAVPHYQRAQGNTPIDQAAIMDTLGFIACYMGVLVVGTLLLTLTAGCSLLDALYEFTSAFGTVGVSNGLTHAGASIGSLLILMLGMVMGRLEIFIVVIGAYQVVRMAGDRMRIITEKMRISFR